jgi:hypothetical protein
MIKLPAKIVSGHGLASKNLPAQLPLLCKYIDALKDCHPGTINVLIEQPVRIVRPDVVTEPLKWSDQHAPEVFHLTAVEFRMPTPGGERGYSAWVYGPQNLPHRADPYRMQILTGAIELPKDGRCWMKINRTNHQRLRLIGCSCRGSHQLEKSNG